MLERAFLSSIDAIDMFLYQDIAPPHRLQKR
jgi:hypothetical protein